MSYATSALSSTCDCLVVAIVVAAGPDSLPAPRCRLPTPARAAIEADAGHEWHRREGEAAMMEPIEASEREPVEARRKSWPDREAARPDKPAAHCRTPPPHHGSLHPPPRHASLHPWPRCGTLRPPPRRGNRRSLFRRESHHP